MLELYTICAIVGGTLFLAQLVLGLLGHGGGHDFGADHDVGGGDHELEHDGGEHGSGNHGINLHGMLSFRALVVGVTLFGLTGRTVAESSLSTWLVLPIALGAGLLGLVVMALIVQGLSKLEAEGTLHIEQALGEKATVYLTIPARKSGPGKITITVQNRELELAAMTEGAEIPTGALVEVTDLLEGDMLLVTALKSEDLGKAAKPSNETGEGRTHA